MYFSRVKILLKYAQVKGGTNYMHQAKIFYIYVQMLFRYFINLISIYSWKELCKSHINLGLHYLKTCGMVLMCASLRT